MKDKPRRHSQKINKNEAFKSKPTMMINGIDNRGFQKRNIYLNRLNRSKYQVNI